MKKFYSFILCACLLTQTYAQTILLNENFSSGLPSGWTVDSAGTTPVYGFLFPGFFVPSGNGFDNLHLGISASSTNIYNDCNLTTKVINASALSSVYIGYSEQFEGSTIANGYAIQKIEVSNDSGVTWTTVLNNHYSHGYPSIRNVVDITQVAAGHNNVRARFHYIEHNSNGWWQIDSVVVADSIHCDTPTDNGITVASTSFACTGSPVKIWLDALSRGIGQTYQWQSANPGNMFANISSATSDTLNSVQNGTTYYQCLITCSGLTTHSSSLTLLDTPTTSPVYSTAEIRICNGRDDTLRLVSPYGGVGVTYQWESSPVSIVSYTDIPGATNDYYIVSSSNFTNNTNFMCKQICNSNGATNSPSPYTDFVTEPLNPHPICYCYPFSGNDCTLDYFISNLTIAGTTLNNTTGCIDSFPIAGTNNYAFFPPSLGYTTAHLSRNTTYTFTVQHDTAFSYYMNISLWIDFDRNGYFDANEYTYVGFLLPYTPYSFSVTVPINAQPGVTGLRLRGHMYSPLDSTDACLETIGGTTQDYMVTIDTTTGTSNVEQAMMNIEVFPNPTKDEITVSSKEFGNNVQIKVTDITGREILTQKKLTVNCKLKTVNLTSGIYFVKVQTEKGRVVKKFIKE